MNKAYMIVATMVAALCLIYGVSSAGDENSDNRKTIKVVDKEVKHSARMAYIDPVTGELTSTPAKQDGEQSQVVEQEPTPAQVIEHENGMVEVILDGQMHSSLTASVECDGKISTKHADANTTDALNSDCDN